MSPDGIDRQEASGTRDADVSDAEAAASSAARDRRDGTIWAPALGARTALIWLPVPVMAVVFAVGTAVEPSTAYDPAWLFAPLNLFFLAMVPLAAAALAVAAYRRTGVMAILALGAGMLATGIGCGLLPAVLLYVDDPNAMITIHNSSALIATGFQFLAAVGAVLALSLGHNRGRHVVVVYGAVVVLIAIVLPLYLAGEIQPFWTDQGPTRMRQAVVFAAVALAALSATLWWETMIRDRSIAFLDWYVPGLLLLAIGLAGAMAQSVLGGLVDWIGRIGEYIAAVYMLIAVAVEMPALRSSASIRTLGASIMQASMSLQPLVDSTADAVIVVGRRGHVLYWNEAAHRMFGHEPGRVFDREAWTLMLAPGVASDRRDALRALLRRPPVGATYAGQLNLSRSDGSDFPADLTVFVNPSDQRMTVCIVGDATERVRYHEELEARVQERTSQLEALNEQLERANAAKDEFLGLVSHELKTPITSILAAGAMLRRRLADADEDFLVEDLIAESSRLAGIIDNLLALARLDAGPQIEHEPQVLDRVLATAVRAVQHQYPDRSIEVTAEQGLVVEANPDQLAMVLQNYLSNALKYSPAGTTVEAAVSKRRGRAVVEVMDRGIGIDDEDLARLYEPFYRGGGAGRAAGMGIGLTVCRRIVESLGGTVSASARPGGGSIFSFSLPLTHIDIDEHSHRDTRTAAPTRQPAR
jgi:PAS domain S-box-containing protein